MNIINSSMEDLPEIFRLYDCAVAFQKTKYNLHWPVFEVEMVKQEILQNQQWKLRIDGDIACVWATTFNDPLIWEDRNNDPAVYIHRIATNPKYRGQKLVEKIVTWAITHAKQNGKKFVRLDTVGDNKKLIAYYEQCNFTFLGLFKINNGQGLPAHYQNAIVSLFEMDV